MQSNDEISSFQDTSTQAMTEVALGLSMAFFALLIIALFSVSLPKSELQTKLSPPQEKQTEVMVEVSLAQNKAAPSQDEQASKPDEDPFIALYWGGKYFDIHHQIISLEEVQSAENLVIAVDPQIPFEQLITIQKEFAGKEMRLTRLTPQWLTSLDRI